MLVVLFVLFEFLWILLGIHCSSSVICSLFCSLTGMLKVSKEVNYLCLNTLFQFQWGTNISQILTWKRERKKYSVCECEPGREWQTLNAGMWTNTLRHCVYVAIRQLSFQKGAQKLVFQYFCAKHFQLVWTTFENSISLLNTYLTQTSQKFQSPLLELINSLN